MSRVAMRRVLRAGSGGVAEAGAFLLYHGGDLLWGAVQILPGPWNPPAGLAALGALYLGGLIGIMGLLLTGAGAALLAVGWMGAGLPRPRRSRCGATPPAAGA